MRQWIERPTEVAHLFNPAFCASVLAHSARGFTAEASAGLPWLLSFVIVPLILHKATREVSPTIKTTKFHAWIERNPLVRVGFSDRARSMVPHVREAMIFGASTGLLVCDACGNVFAGPRLPKREANTASEEVRECFRRARTLGAVLASGGTEHTVLAMLGVQV